MKNIKTGQVRKEYKQIIKTHSRKNHVNKDFLSNICCYLHTSPTSEHKTNTPYSIK